MFIYSKFTNKTQLIPYGKEFFNRQQLVDFLVCYGKKLENDGLVFQTRSPDLNLVLDWDLSVREFLNWSNQGWKSSSLIVLSPVVNKLTIDHPGFVLDEINDPVSRSMIVDINSNTVKVNDISVLRESNQSEIEIDGVIGFAKISLKQYEHAVIIKNITGFANDDVTSKLKFEVAPNPVGLVGRTFKDKCIYYDCDLENTNTSMYNLSHSQINKTNDLKFSLTCPIFKTKDEVVAILAIDSRQKIDISGKNEKIITNSVNNFSTQLYEYVPDLFKEI